MNTLIIPCAGKSSRFPNMKPKYLLTHPDGKLMIEKSMEELNIEIFDRIIITIVKPHNDQYDSKLVLKQVFHDNSKIEICILDDFTTSASETIYQTLMKMNVKGSFVIKDSDNQVGVLIPNPIKNAIVGYDLKIHPNTSNIPAKSFLIINEQNLVQDIIEKKIVSDKICLGVYCFENADDFKNTYEKMKTLEIKGEMFVSHLISYLLQDEHYVFEALFAKTYSDWGTLKEWQQEQHRMRTYFIDVDGVILKNSGKYGQVNWYNNTTYLTKNVETILRLQEQGAQIVITTSRQETFRFALEKLLSDVGIKPYAILMGMNHATRVLINDFAPTNPYPSSVAITFPRDSDLSTYLD